MDSKIKAQHPEVFNHIKTAIETYLLANPDLVENYQTGKFPRSEAVKNLQLRFCFDVMWLSGLTAYISQTVYPLGFNDDHLYSALKQIVPKIERHY